MNLYYLYKPKVKETLYSIKNNSNNFLQVSCIQQFCELLGIKNEDIVALYCDEKYNHFTIQKNGKTREISAPVYFLSRIQKKLNYYLQAVYKNCCHRDCNNSYIITSLEESKLNKSNILNNAYPHIGKKIVLNIDIKDFYYSIHINKIRNIFSRLPFRFSEELVKFIADIVSYENTLPIGAPTSPILSNFALIDIDEQFANIPNLTYTRYADDLTFSTNYYTKNQLVLLSKNIISILNQNSFFINDNKFKISLPNERQEVTGIIVNKKLNIQRIYIRNIRAILHSIETKGIEIASKIYAEKNKKRLMFHLRKYYAKKSIKMHVTADIINEFSSKKSLMWYIYHSIAGKILHVGLVKGYQNDVFLKLKKRFNILFDVFLSGKKEEILPTLEVSPKIAYITNATAKSIVFQVYNYLKNNSETYILNKKLNFDKIMHDFINQATYFLDVYAKTIGYIKYSKDFNRNIFHLNRDCRSKNSDYTENRLHYANTGTFYDEKYDFYVLRTEFLEIFGMRACKNCF